MKTKEEILAKWESESADRILDRVDYNERVIFPAMQEYAEQYLKEKVEGITDEEILNHILQLRNEVLYPQNRDMSTGRWLNLCLDTVRAFRDGKIK
jgi:hypothetical protein